MDRRANVVRVALAQVDCDLGDVAGNIARAREHIEEARGKGADLIVFPELNLTGYSLGELDEDPSLAPSSGDLDPLRQAADGLAVVVGFSEAGRLHNYNSAAYLEDGELVHLHRKLYLPTYGVFEERKHFTPGQALRAFETRLGYMAILICNDAWQPALPFLAVQDGAGVLVVPANSSLDRFPGDADMRREWQDINRFYARMLESYVIFVNRVGTEGELRFWGGSHVFDPWGQMVAEAPLDEPALLVVELDLAAIRRRRRQMPLVKEARLALLARELERIAAEGGDL